MKVITFVLLTLMSSSGMLSASMSLTKSAGVVPLNVTVYSVITAEPILVTPILSSSLAVNGFAAVAVPLTTV